MLIFKIQSKEKLIWYIQTEKHGLKVLKVLVFYGQTIIFQYLMCTQNTAAFRLCYSRTMWCGDMHSAKSVCCILSQ